MVPEKQANNDKDENEIAYEKLKLDPDWFLKYKGKYVAIVNGKQVFPNIMDKQELLKKIQLNYPDQHRYFQQVEAKLDIIDLYDSYLFDYIDI